MLGKRTRYNSGLQLYQRYFGEYYMDMLSPFFFFRTEKRTRYQKWLIQTLEEMLNPSKIPFLYLLNAGEPRRRSRPDKPYLCKLLLRQQLRKFYGNIGLKELLMYAKRAHFGGGFPSRKVLTFLELRLDIILYRLNFLENWNSSFRQFFNHNRFVRLIVNGACIKADRKKVITVGDVFRFSDSDFFFLLARRKLLSRQILHNIPYYFEINYRIMTAICFVAPSSSVVFYPFKSSFGGGFHLLNFYKS